MAQSCPSCTLDLGSQSQLLILWGVGNLYICPECNVEITPSALALHRVAEKETVNKMSLHNLATVFGPTLLRPSEKESKLPANPSQPITMTDSWSLEVMSQV